MILSHLADEAAAVTQYGVVFFLTNSGASNVWMSGVFGVFADSDWTRQWTGAAWQTRDTVFGLAFPGGFDLWAGGTAQVWYASGRGIWQWTGAVWNEDVSLTNGSSGFFAGSSASDLYCLLGGTQSGIGVLRSYYWDGASWAGPNTAPVNWPFASFYNVHARPAGMTPDGTLYAGIDLRARVSGLDDASIVAYLDSGTWQPGLTLDAGRVVWTLWAADDSNVFVISQYTAGGAEEYNLWQGSGASWSTVAVPSAPAGHLYRWYGVRGVSAGDYWLVGENVLLADSTSTGIAAHWTGAGWTLDSFAPGAGGSTFVCAAVTAVAANDVWIGADTSSATWTHVPTAYHWNGTSWTERSPFV